MDYSKPRITYKIEASSLLKKLDKLCSKESVIKALGEVGAKVEQYAKENLRNNGNNKTGRLSGSITHVVDETDNTVTVGTNVFYAPFLEMGTGAYAVNGDGRQGYWVYVDGESQKSDGEKKDYSGVVYSLWEALRIKDWLINEQGCNPNDVYITQGQHPSPYLQPALTEHTEEIEQIFKEVIAEEMVK